jgi:thiamine-phosphate diphosphorylase
MIRTSKGGAVPSSIRGLYVIIDPHACGGRAPIDVARQAVTGGARVLQWRDKLRDKGDQLDDARDLARLCRLTGTPLIINDHADLALACGAEGLHLGQHDLPIAAVRPFVGPAMIIGVSTNDADEARAAEAADADYVAVGAIFATDTKGNTRPADIERLRSVKDAVSIPVVAIGGINASNIDDVVAAGADAAAVISAVCGADDPSAAARELAGAWSRAGR